MTSRRALLVLLALLAVGTILRLEGLDTRGVGHIEMYAPNLPLPEGLSIPPPRLTLLKTLTGSMWEPHPPAWYVLNWPWTRVFGTTPQALRLPSALLGIFSLWLLWRLALRERGVAVAAVATLLLTLNGAHVMWSQIARPVTLASMLALASSIVLIRLVAAPSRFLLLTYAALSALGMATEYYYWFIFGGQLVWVLFVSAARREYRAPLLQWQFVVLVLASPLVTLAVSQSRESYLSDALGDAMVRYLGFGFLLGPAWATPGLGGLLLISTVLVGAVCLVCAFVFGSYWEAEPASQPASELLPEPPMWLLTATTMLAVLGIVAVSLVLARFGMGTRGRLLPTSVAPVVMMTGLWGLLTALRSGVWRPTRVLHLSTTLALVPPVVVFGISLVMPFIDSKYFLLFTPFLDVVIAEGIVAVAMRLGRAPRLAAAGALAVWLAVAHVASARFFGSVDATPVDYRGLAAQLQPQLRESDHIFVFSHWAMTSLFYYVPASPGRYVAGNYSQAIERSGGSFWVVSLRDAGIADPAPLRAAVAGCTPVSTLTAAMIRAERYDHCQPARP